MLKPPLSMYLGRCPKTTSPQRNTAKENRVGFIQCVWSIWYEQLPSCTSNTGKTGFQNTKGYQGTGFPSNDPHVC